jgi:succinyl-diaminopimelate desuccinylase
MRLERAKPEAMSGPTKARCSQKILVTLGTIQCGQSPNPVTSKAEATAHIRLPLGFSVADARKEIGEKITDLERVDEYLRG